MIHLPTLPGYPQHKGMNIVKEKALYDAHQLKEGGIDKILIENNDDNPHRKLLGPEQIAAYSVVAYMINEELKGDVPLGICCLWNDPISALAIANQVGADFIRVPIFTEASLPAPGYIQGRPYDLITYRDKLKLNHVRILADVDVKHASSQSRRPIEELAADILGSTADELIITGTRTGVMPLEDDLKAVRDALPDCYINIGSGTTPENIEILKKYANAFIVGTYFKDDNGRISSSRVETLKALM